MRRLPGRPWYRPTSSSAEPTAFRTTTSARRSAPPAWPTMPSHRRVRRTDPIAVRVDRPNVERARGVIRRVLELRDRPRPRRLGDLVDRLRGTRLDHLVGEGVALPRPGALPLDHDLALRVAGERRLAERRLRRAVLDPGHAAHGETGQALLRLAVDRGELTAEDHVLVVGRHRPRTVLPRAGRRATVGVREPRVEFRDRVALLHQRVVARCRPGRL